MAVDPRAHGARKIPEQRKQHHGLRREQQAQLRGLPAGVAALRHHELRQERQKEQHHFRIDGVGEQPLGKQPAQALIGQRRLCAAVVARMRAAPAAQGANAQPHQVRAAQQLERPERHRRRQDQGAHADGRQHRVAQAPQRAADAEHHAPAAAARHAHAEHHQVVRSRRNGDQHGSAEKADELFSLQDAPCAPRRRRPRFSLSDAAAAAGHARACPRACPGRAAGTAAARGAGRARRRFRRRRQAVCGRWPARPGHCRRAARADGQPAAGGQGGPAGGRLLAAGGATQRRPPHRVGDRSQRLADRRGGHPPVRAGRHAARAENRLPAAARVPAPLRQGRGPAAGPALPGADPLCQPLLCAHAHVLGAAARRVPAAGGARKCADHRLHRRPAGAHSVQLLHLFDHARPLVAVLLAVRAVLRGSVGHDLPPVGGHVRLAQPALALRAVLPAARDQHPVLYELPAPAADRPAPVPAQPHQHRAAAAAAARVLFRAQLRPHAGHHRHHHLDDDGAHHRHHRLAARLPAGALFRAGVRGADGAGPADPAGQRGPHPGAGDQRPADHAAGRHAGRRAAGVCAGGPDPAAAQHAGAAGAGAHGRTDGSQGARRGGEPPPHRLPVRHEPRHPHPAGRRDRHDQVRHARPVGARQDRGIPAHRPAEQRVAAGHPQRHPRFFQDRRRPPVHRNGGLRPDRADRRRTWHPAGPGRRQEPAAALRPGPGHAALRARRPHAAAPDPAQFAGQRHQVHRPRGSAAQRHRAVYRRRALERELRSRRHRSRHPARHPAPPVPEVRAGRPLHHPPLRRHRPGSGHLQGAGAADGRRHRRRKPRGRGLHLQLHAAAGGGLGAVGRPGHHAAQGASRLPPAHPVRRGRAHQPDHRQHAAGKHGPRHPHRGKRPAGAACPQQRRVRPGADGRPHADDGRRTGHAPGARRRQRGLPGARSGPGKNHRPAPEPRPAAACSRPGAAARRPARGPGRAVRRGAGNPGRRRTGLGADHAAGRPVAQAPAAHHPGLPRRSAAPHGHRPRRPARHARRLGLDHQRLPAGHGGHPAAVCRAGRSGGLPQGCHLRHGRVYGGVAGVRAGLVVAVAGGGAPVPGRGRRSHDGREYCAAARHLPRQAGRARVRRQFAGGGHGVCRGPDHRVTYFVGGFVALAVRRQRAARRTGHLDGAPRLAGNRAGRPQGRHPGRRLQYVCLWPADPRLRRRRAPAGLEDAGAGNRADGAVFRAAAAPPGGPHGAHAAGGPVPPPAVRTVVADGHVHVCRAGAGVRVAAVLFRTHAGPLAHRNRFSDDAMGGAGGGDGADCRAPERQVLARGAGRDRPGAAVVRPRGDADAARRAHRARHRLAHGMVRHRLRIFPGAQPESDHGQRAQGAGRQRQRHRGHVAPDGTSNGRGAGGVLLHHLRRQRHPLRADAGSSIRRRRQHRQFFAHGVQGRGGLIRHPLTTTRLQHNIRQAVIRAQAGVQRTTMASVRSVLRGWLASTASEGNPSHHQCAPANCRVPGITTVPAGFCHARLAPALPLRPMHIRTQPTSVSAMAIEEASYN
uniref:Uncharacterized protein n=1 Tax=Tanacetum cinerariifolium TaxID=118510 RepID=A0A699GM00_TANCI|nr:hypothetical protein [Tanacetum cinerariifolium]